jgi:hypothetical protein
MARALDLKHLDAVAQAIVDRLGGDWLLVGGAAVALWLDPTRTTEDVDLVGFRGTPDERFALFGLAQDLGLPIEALNSAADFFVKRISDWEAQVEPFRTGTKGRLFRPTPTLFLLLKLRRLSERDLADCLLLIRRVARDRLSIDLPRILAEIDALPPPEGRDLGARRATLARALRRLAPPLRSERATRRPGRKTRRR